MTFSQEQSKITMRYWNTIFLFVFVCGKSSFVHANFEDDAAREAFAKGTEAYRDVEFAEALLLFEEAYKLRPTYKILFNIAQTQLELRRPHLALEAFEKYMVEGGKNIDDDRRDEVVREIRKLRRVVGEIIVLGQTGTECRIDDEHVGFLPLDRPLRLESGNHEITIHLHGEIVCRKEVEIVAGKKRIEQCKARDDSQEGPAPESIWDVMSNTTLGEYDIGMTHSDATPKESLFWKVSPWIFTGAAALTAATGTVLALKTSSLNSELRGACDGGDCPAARQNDVDKLSKLAVGADVLFVATSILSAAAVTFFILKKKKARRQSDVPGRGSVRLEEDISRTAPFGAGGGG